MLDRFAECDIDGFYAKVQKSQENPTEGYCVDKYVSNVCLITPLFVSSRLGTPLQDFHGSEYKGEFSSMDCECAMVRHLITGDWGEKPVCTRDSMRVTGKGILYNPFSCAA